MLMLLSFSLLKLKKYEKTDFFCILKFTEDSGTDPNPLPDPLVRGTASGPVPVTDPEHCFNFFA
jgi:hypothetical protein